MGVDARQRERSQERAQADPPDQVEEGAVITDVEPGTPAEEAGLGYTT